MSQKLLFKRDKILRHPESYAGRRVCHALHRDCNVTRVTWPEFIGHVISTDLAMMDSHWYPVTEQCGLCSEELHYDLVIRMERLQEQWVMVSSLSGVSLPPLPHMNQGETRASQGDKKYIICKSKWSFFQRMRSGTSGNCHKMIFKVSTGNIILTLNYLAILWPIGRNR